MGKTLDHYIIILCGGAGPRLWPLSRASQPKQFLHLLSQKTLIQETTSRFLKFISRKNIFIISNQKYLSKLKHLRRGLVPNANIIGEPYKKNTTMAVLYGASIIKKINPLATITVTPADHYINPINKFQKDITNCYHLAKYSDKIVTIGIKPDNPDPSYGYILPADKENNYYPVKKFIEKPTIIDAQTYIKKNSYWNSGIYSFQIKTFETQLALYQKDYFLLYQKLLNQKNSLTITNRIYQLAQNIPFDVAISEKSNDLIMVLASFNWSDIGEWQSLFQLISKNKEGLALLNKTTLSVSHNSNNCLLSGIPKKLIGLVGVSNLAVIDTPDALLVCNLNDSFYVRNLISKITSHQKFKKFFLSGNDKRTFQ